MLNTQEALLSILDEIDIAYQNHEHPAVFTVEEADKHHDGIDGAHEVAQPCDMIVWILFQERLFAALLFFSFCLQAETFLLCKPSFLRQSARLSFPLANAFLAEKLLAFVRLSFRLSTGCSSVCIGPSSEIAKVA